MKQIIFIVILILLLLGTVYLWYNYLGSRTISVEEEKPHSFTETRLTELRRLKTLELDVSIIKDPLFASLENPLEILKDFQTPSPQAGRINPFLPL